MSDEWLKQMPLDEGQWTVLLQSAAASWWAVVSNGSLSAAPFRVGECDVGLPSGEPFAATAFDGAGTQLRWLRDRRVGASEHKEHTLECSLCIDSQLLLWGVATGLQKDGWTVMAHSRIGRYPVPAVIPQGSRAVLCVHELLKSDDEGNVAVGGAIWHKIAVKEVTA